MTQNDELTEEMLEAGAKEAMRQFGPYRVDLLNQTALEGSCGYIYKAMVEAASPKRTTHDTDHD